MLVARRYLFLCVLPAVLGPGCEDAREADLLEVTSVGPAEIGPGHSLVVEGGPFAIHHPVSVRLIGQLARPFEPAEPITEDFRAQAVAEGRIEVTIAERTLRERFGRATFHGAVEVREEARWQGLPGAVLGRSSEVTIDFVPARSIDTTERSLDRVLGVAWMPSSAPGLAIASVDPEGRGRALGLAPGDVLLGEGDARFVPGDAPVVPADVLSVDLALLREGEPERRVACVLGDRRDDDAARDLARLAQLAIVLAWIALLRALPLASIDYAAPRPAPALTRPSAALLARAAGSIVIAYGLVRLAASGLAPSLPVVIAALAGLRAAIRFADARGEPRSLPLAVGGALGLAAGLSVLPIAEGSADLATLTRDGSASVLAWPLFAQPAGPIALGLVGVSVATSRPSQRALGLLDDLVVLAIGSLVVIEGTGLSPVGRAGVVALSVSTALTTWLLAQVRGRISALPAAIAIAGLVALAGLSLGAWTFADPSTLARTTAAETVLVMSAALALSLVHRAMRTRAPARVSHALL